MAEDTASARAELAELGERVRRLEERLARVERGMAPARAAADAVPAASPVRRPLDTDLTVASVFTRVAMLSFVLLGALILRVLTQQHVLNAVFGTVLGVAYAAHLVVLALLPGRLGRFAAATSLFQCCGVLLGYGIALESLLRAHTLPRPMAVGLAGGFACLGLAVAAVYRKAALALVALAGGMLALVALGLEADGIVLQSALLVALGAAGAWFSWTRPWSFLRPVLFPLLMILLAVGMPLAARNSLDRLPLHAGAVAFWLVLTAQHALVFARLGLAACWWPLATAWLLGIGWLAGWPRLDFAAAGVSAAALVATVFTARLRPQAVAGAAGTAATCVVAGLAGGSMLDPSGILCALSGMALWMAAPGRGSRPAWAIGASVVLLLGAGTLGVIHVTAPDASSTLRWSAGGLLAVLLLAHYIRAGMPDADGTGPGPAARYGAPLTLIAGLCVLFAVLRSVTRGLLPDPHSAQLAQTLILAGGAVVLTYWGHSSRRRAVLYAGLACMFIALLKVGLADLGQLAGLRLLASIVALGLSSVAVSVIMRQRTP